MRTQLEGGCACGTVRYRLSSEVLFGHCCHCLNCQRQTGSAFVINLLIETDCVEILALTRNRSMPPRDDRSVQRIFRCPQCQVAVFSEYSRPGVSFVRGGTLDDPRSVTPNVHIYTRSKVGWLSLPDGAAAFDEYYDPSSFGRTKAFGVSSELVATCLREEHAAEPGACCLSWIRRTAIRSSRSSSCGAS